MYLIVVRLIVPTQLLPKADFVRTQFDLQSSMLGLLEFYAVKIWKLRYETERNVAYHIYGGIRQVPVQWKYLPTSMQMIDVS